MLIGYIRVSKADGSQSLELQKDALIKAGVKEDCIYEDYASGNNEKRPGLIACLKAIREGDILVIWKIDRLGRNLKDLIVTVQELEEKDIGLKVLTGQGANIDTTTPNGRLVFGIFAALAEYERDLIIERTKAGLEGARARGRNGGRPFTMTRSKLEIAQAALQNRTTNISALCKELQISRNTLYRYLSPNGELREQAEKLT